MKINNPEKELKPYEEALEDWHELFKPMEEIGFRIDAFDPGVQFFDPDGKRGFTLSVSAVKRINQAIKRKW